MSRISLIAKMSESVKNVAIFGATGMTGLATLPIAVSAGEEGERERGGGSRRI